MIEIKVNSTIKIGGKRIKGSLLITPHKTQEIKDLEIDYPKFLKVERRTDRMWNEFLDIEMKDKVEAEITISYSLYRRPIGDISGEDFLSESRYIKFKDIPNLEGENLTKVKNALMIIKGKMKYDKEKAKVKSASSSLRLGYGVCVNFSHAFIAIMRKNGIPARIVVGIPPGIYDAAHAWVQVKLDKHWIDVDPTAGIVTRFLPYAPWGIGEDESEVKSKIIGINPHISEKHITEIINKQ